MEKEAKISKRGYVAVCLLNLCEIYFVIEPNKVFFILSMGLLFFAIGPKKSKSGKLQFGNKKIGWPKHCI